MDKKLSYLGALLPPEPRWGSAPDPHYRLELRACHASLPLGKSWIRRWPSVQVNTQKCLTSHGYLTAFRKMLACLCIRAVLHGDVESYRRRKG